MKIAIARIDDQRLMTMLSDEPGYSVIHEHFDDVEVVNLYTKDDEGLTVVEQCFRRGFWPAMDVSAPSNNLTDVVNYASPHVVRGGAEFSNYIDDMGAPSNLTDEVYPMGDIGYYLAVCEGVYQLACWTHVNTLMVTRDNSRRLLNRGNYFVRTVINNDNLPEGWAPAEPINQVPAGPTGMVNVPSLPLHPYHTNPVRYFGLTLASNTLYVGLELEFRLPDFSISSVEPDRLIKWFKLVELQKEGVLTKDSTVDGELVLSPFEPEQLKLWLEENKDWVSSLSYAGEVGAHMHVSRSAFTSELAQAYFVCDVTSDAGNPEMEWLFGQPSEKWASTAKKDLKSWNTGKRRSAVNTRNSKTLEVRAFRGTGDYQILSSRIDYLVSKVKESNELAEKSTESVSSAPSGDLLDEIDWERPVVSSNGDWDGDDDIEDIDF